MDPTQVSARTFSYGQALFWSRRNPIGDKQQLQQQERERESVSGLNCLKRAELIKSDMLQNQAHY